MRRQYSIFRNILNSFNPFAKETYIPMTILDTLEIDPYWKENWVTMTDRSFGGNSKCNLELQSDLSGFSFVKFSGLLSFSEIKAQELGVSGSCCAFRVSFLNCFDNLENYEGFEIIYRSETPLETIINLTMSNLPADDIFQGVIRLSPGSNWKTLHIPFTEFKLTFLGRIKNKAQRSFEDCFIDTFGILIKNHPGNFALDLHSIKIVHKIDAQYVTQKTYKRPIYLKAPQQ